VKPVRRPGNRWSSSPSRVKRLQQALARTGPVAYVKIRSARVDDLATALSLGGHTTRLARRAARLAAASTESKDSSTVIAYLVPLSTTPKVFARLWAASLHSEGESFVRAVRAHPASDTELLGLLDVLPANTAASLIGSIYIERRVLKAAYGIDLDVAVKNIAASEVFAHDATFASVRARLDALAVGDPSGSWASLLATELTDAHPVPSVQTHRHVTEVLERITALGPRVELAWALRKAGTPASLDELAVLVEHDTATVA
jgi:hypothetical protein